MDKSLNIISNSFLFKGLPENQLKEIENITVEKGYEKGEAVFFEGDEANGFYLVADGMVKVFKLSSEGKEQILHILGPGEPFGEVAVFHGVKFPANAEALTKSRFIFLPRDVFVELISSNPSLSLNMIAVLSLRLRQFAIQVENLSLKEVPGRLATYLIYLAEEQGSEDSVTLTISKGQLASLLGTIPETLSRIFAKMSSQNLIEVKDRTIKLLDREGLEVLSEFGNINPG
ncbi:MAG: Crp/Fnr family transcriptional regulator [Deltaproteobacteria bacterium]|nr:Crp/Fnr family transcriptional regulator [Deltaproteobacteria bacterium]